MSVTHGHGRVCGPESATPSSCTCSYPPTVRLSLSLPLSLSLSLPLNRVLQTISVLFDRAVDQRKRQPTCTLIIVFRIAGLLFQDFLSSREADMGRIIPKMGTYTIQKINLMIDDHDVDTRSVHGPTTIRKRHEPARCLIQKSDGTGSIAARMGDLIH